MQTVVYVGRRFWYSMIFKRRYQLPVRILKEKTNHYIFFGSSGINYPRRRESCALDYSSEHFQSYPESKLAEKNEHEIA
jgi:hypothetical protein